MNTKENSPSAPYFPMQEKENSKIKELNPQEKRLVNWIEDVVTIQRVNLVLLLITFMMLLLHLTLDFFFHI